MKILRTFSPRGYSECKMFEMLFDRNRKKIVEELRHLELGAYAIDNKKNVVEWNGYEKDIPRGHTAFFIQEKDITQKGFDFACSLADFDRVGIYNLDKGVEIYA